MKRRSVYVSPEAYEDLMALSSYISTQSSAEVAARYIDRIEGFLSKLDMGSERGTRRDDIRSGLRVIGFEGRITVAFSSDDDRVTVLAILYGGRDWPNLLA